MSTEKIFPRDYAELEEKIGHVFRDKKLLEEALTHSSFSNEHKVLGRRCNERLEFFGDSVLQLVVSDYIFFGFPEYPEGTLTKLRSKLVDEPALASYAAVLHLGEYLYLGKGEEKNGGRTRESVTADAYEALIAAVFIDAGEGAEGREAVRKYIMPEVEKRRILVENELGVTDYKTLLQEVVQSDSKGTSLEYNKIGESGPDHDKTFTVEALVDCNRFGVGTGKTVRAAEQEAARQALVKCGVLKENEA